MIVVVCDEPASITDAYAVIKVLSRDHGVDQFNVLVNKTDNAKQAADVFSKINRVAERFLDVTLNPSRRNPEGHLPATIHPGAGGGRSALPRCCIRPGVPHTGSEDCDLADTGHSPRPCGVLRGTERRCSQPSRRQDGAFPMSAPSSEYLKNEGMDQADLVRKHAPLVKRIAYHLIGRLPSSVDVDDLIQAGTIGLLMASRNFSPDKGANFETYAGIRIRGAMIDELRKSDWTPRSVHRKIREVTEAIARIENQTGARARDIDVAESLGISTEEYHEILKDATAARLFSLDQPADDSGEPLQVESDAEQEPSELLQEASRRERLVELIEELPERERLIMSLYYDEELNLREIGEVLSISESRVCQIHGQALLRLKSRIDD